MLVAPGVEGAVNPTPAGGAGGGFLGASVSQPAGEGASRPRSNCSLLSPAAVPGSRRGGGHAAPSITLGQQLPGTGASPCRVHAGAVAG